MAEKIKLALVGLGYWGPHYLRLAQENEQAELLWCCDLNQEVLDNIKKKNPEIKTTTSVDEMLADPAIQAVIIATPTVTHYQLAKKSLEAGKHLLVEKPITRHVNEAEELIKLAEEKNSKLMVGNTFLYNPAVRYLKEELIDKGILGDIIAINFRRTGLGPVRKDVNALWDLAPHDISMLNYFLPPQENKVKNIVARGVAYLKGDTEDTIYTLVTYANNKIASIHTSWLDPIKIREVTIVGTEKMAVFDDVELARKVTIFDKGATYKEDESFAEYLTAFLHDGDIVIPKVPTGEPLKEEFNHFLDCLINNKTPFTSAQQGLENVKILAAAQQSLEESHQ